MAIAYGNSPVRSTSQTYSSPIISGSDVLGVVWVTGDVAADNVTAVTWDGVSMTKVGAIKIPSDRWLSMWAILNPTAGATTVAFTGGSFWASSSDFWTGAGSATADSVGTNSGTGIGALALTTTVVASNCWLLYGITDGAGNTVYTTDVGSMRFTGATNGSGAAAWGDSNGTVSTGSNTVTLTPVLGTTNRAGIIASFAPPSAAGPANLKTYDTNAKANIKTMNTNPLANVKTFDTNA